MVLRGVAAIAGVVVSFAGAGSVFLVVRWGIERVLRLMDLLPHLAMAGAATAAHFDNWSVFVAPVDATCDGGWAGIKSFRCMEHVRIVLGRGNVIGIFICNTCARMGLEVGARVGGLLVGLA